MNSKRKANKSAASAIKNAEEVERRVSEWKALPPIKLGDFEVPKFDGPSVVFGADLRQYPPMASIPEEFQRHSGKFQDIVSALFFNGGRLEDHGIRLKADVSKVLAMAAIRAWMCSFAPQHEHKTATVAWALSEWTEPAP